MKKSGLYLLAILLCTLQATAITNYVTDDKVVGLWTFSAPDAPYGYQDGTIEIKKQQEKLTGEVKIGNSVININEIKKDGDYYTCRLYVDGQQVDMKIKPDNEKMTGSADAGGWLLPVTLIKK